MKSDDWLAWLREQTGGGTNREMANRAGIDASNLTRWAKGEPPDAVTVIKIGRTLRRSPIEALVAAGHLTSSEGDLREVPATLEQFSDALMLQELLRRTLRRVDEDEAAEVGQVLLAWAGGGDPDDPNQVTALAARRGISRGEAVRQAQDDDAHG